jgi:DNA-binding NarL/FixJ family response regulator
MTKAEIKKIVEQDISKSQRMIQLYNGGLEVKDIANVLGVRYNFVYNVVSDYCRRNDVQMRVVQKENKKAKIIQLIEAGKSNVEISAELKCCYNYVFGVRKAYEKEKAKAQ